VINSRPLGGYDHQSEIDFQEAAGLIAARRIPEE
jgi:hypothetical protein